jgi:glycosyl transferase family 25
MPKKYRSNLLHSYIDQVYVLSVKSFRDRINHIENEMGRHGIPFQFIFDYDIPQLSKDVLKKHFTQSTLSLAQKSLVLKHIEAWKEALKHNYKHILIFEDDVILDKHFHKKLAVIIQTMKGLPKDFLVFLGGADTKVPDYFFLTSGPLVKLPLSTAEGYIVDLKSIKKRLLYLKKHKINLPADHLITKIDRVNKTSHYWSKEPLVEQGSVTGKFITKLDQHRLKHSIYFNILRYQWNKLQRRKLRGFFVKFKHFLMDK